MYEQEFSAGIAENMAIVLALNKTGQRPLALTMKLTTSSRRMSKQASSTSSEVRRAGDYSIDLVNNYRGMMSIARYQDIHRYVGNTPLIRLRRLSRRLGKGSCVRLDLGLFIATGRVRFTADVS